jgi:hypothetical protein
VQLDQARTNCSIAMRPLIECFPPSCSTIFKRIRGRRRCVKSGAFLRLEAPFYLLDFAGLETEQDGILARFFHSNRHLKDNSQARVLMRRAFGRMDTSLQHRVSRERAGAIAAPELARKTVF